MDFARCIRFRFARRTGWHLWAERLWQNHVRARLSGLSPTTQRAGGAGWKTAHQKGLLRGADDLSTSRIGDQPALADRQSLCEAYQPPADLLELLSLDPHWFERFPHELSNGELQRVAVARALSPQTRYLIADEMTTMLDANTQAQIWQALLGVVQQRELGMLVISHELPLLERVCTRIVEFSSIGQQIAFHGQQS